MSTNKGYMKAYNSIEKPNSKSSIARQAELSARPIIFHSCSVCGAREHCIVQIRASILQLMFVRSIGRSKLRPIYCALAQW